MLGSLQTSPGDPPRAGQLEPPFSTPVHAAVGEVVTQDSFHCSKSRGRILVRVVVVVETFLCSIRLAIRGV